MEVHHHSQKSGSGWKHYFWEFFMLFLAVTLGFFVENKREHYVEHKRAKIYAKAMIENLEADTSELKLVVKRGELAANYLDSFLAMMMDAAIENIPTGKLYWYGLWGGYINSFEPNDATFQQMRNTGSLRYFDNLRLEQIIGQYDQSLRSMRVMNENDRPVYLETRKARARIFDFRYNNIANKIVQEGVYRSYQPARIDSFIKSNPPLLTTDRILFNEYAELCRSRQIRKYANDAREALTLAIKIIEELKKFH